MNSPVVFGSKSEEDPQEFLIYMQKVMDIMDVNSSESVELDTY